MGTEDSKALAIKFCGSCETGETPSLTRESFGEAHGVLEHTQTHLHGNQHLKGHNLLVGSKRSGIKWGKSRENGIVPSWNPPHMQHHDTAKWVALPWRTPKAPPLTM